MMLARLLLSALTLASLASAEATAQRAPAVPLQLWADVGVGGSPASLRAHGVFGLGGRLGLQAARGRYVLAARFTENSGGDSGFRGFVADPADTFYDAALLVGYATGPEYRGRLIASAGPALVWGRRVVADRVQEPCLLGGGPCYRDYSYASAGPALGLAVEAGVYGRLFWHLGYSFVAHANVNREQPFVGFTLGLRAGRLR